MGRPREHDSATQAALLQAAGQLLAAEGPGAVSVRRLAEETGTSTRAVYSLFGSKRGLLRALFAQAAEVMRAHHEAVPVRDDPVAEVLDLALAYRAGALAEPNLYDLYLGGWSVADLCPTEDDLALARRSHDRVLDAVRRCADAGLLGGRDPVPVTLELWALVHGLASLELHGFLRDGGSSQRLWRDAVAAMLCGYERPVESVAAATPLHPQADR